MAEVASVVLGFALTLLLHSTLLLGGAWLLERLGLLRHPRWLELAWRGALFGALLSAAAATAWPHVATSFIHATAASASRTSTARELPSPPVAARTVPSAAPDVGLVAADTPRAAAPVPPARPPLLLTKASATWLASLWTAFVLASAALCARRVWGLRRLLHRAWRAAPAAAMQQAQGAALAQALRLPRPRLHQDDGLAGPLALPRSTVLLPRWCAWLSEPQSRALLAHELAHLARRDPAWRIAQHLALAPLCLQPLAWLALRRLDALAERQADATAARLLGDGRALAECLAQCLVHAAASSRRAPRLALAMADRPGAVVDRVQRLLEEDPMQYSPPSPRRTRLALALGLLGALALPTIAVTALAEVGRQGESISVHVDDDGREEIDISVRRAGYALEVEMEGKIEFAPDESDVLSMASDAGLSIEETRDGVERAIAFRPAAGGVTRAYKVGGAAQPFDAAGKAWLAQALPEIFRSTGIDAEARAGRLLARGGTDALLAEIALIRGDHGRARYLGLLFTLATLDATQQQRALALAQEIDSDYELRQALAPALKSQTLAPAQQHQLLGLAAELGSDYERAELLIAASERFTLDPEATRLWTGLLDAMGSDYEKRRVLEALLQRESDGTGAARLAFETARGIGSDYERRQLLEAGLAQVRGDAALRALYLEVAAGIGSDYELKQALLALLQAGPVDAPLALATLEAIARIGSDHECKEALLALIAVMPDQPALVERLRTVARRLGTYERGAVEQALDRRIASR